MPETNIPLSLLSPELEFNLELDTNNRVNKLSTDLSIPQFNIEYPDQPKQYFPDYKPTFDFDKGKVENGMDIYEATLSTNPEIAIKAQEALAKKYSKDKFVSNDFNTPILTPTSQTKRYTSEDFGFQPGVDNEDFYHTVNWDSKGLVNKFITGNKNMFGRIASGAVLKFGEGFGYLGYMLLNIGQDDYWAKVADNGFSRSLEEAEDWTKEELFKVYKSADYDNKGFFSKMGDATFWQDSFADGVAFMASAIIPAGALGKVGQLGKLGRLGTIGRIAATELGGASSWFTRVVNTAGRFNNLAKTGSTINSAVELLTGAKNVGGVTGYLYSIGSEAAFEAADTFKQSKAQLIAQGYSESEANKIASDKATTTFNYNMAILAFSNAFENRLIQKVLNKADIGASAINKFDNDLTVSAEKAGNKFFTDNSWGKRLAFYGKQAGKGFVAEGLWEENAQLAVQRLSQGTYLAKEEGTGRETEKEAGNFFEQVLTNIKDAASGKDLEASESIGTGALIGVIGGAGVSLLTRERSKEEKFKKSPGYLAQIANLNETRNAWLNNNIYETNDDGSIQVGPDNKPIISQAKVVARDSQIALMSSQLNLSKELDNSPELKSMVERTAFTNFALAHLKNGSIDFLIDKLNSWNTEDRETLAAYGFSQEQLSNVSPKEFAKLAQDLKEVYDTTNEIKFTAPKGMSDKDIIDSTRIAKDLLFKVKAENLHLNSVLENGFPQLSEDRFKPILDFEAQLKAVEEVLPISDEIGKKYIEDQKKDLKHLIDLWGKTKVNIPVAKEYNSIKKKQKSLKEKILFNDKDILKYSDKNKALETIEKEVEEFRKSQPVEEPEEQKPVIATIKGTQYTELKDLDDALANKTITQEEYDQALNKNATNIEKKLHTVIKNKDDKFQLQFGDIILSSTFDNEKVANEMANRFTVKNGKYYGNISGLNDEQVDELKGLERELNKVVKAPVKKEEVKTELGTLDTDEDVISPELIELYEHILKLKTLKSVSPDYKKRIADAFFNTDVDINSLDELKEAASELLTHYGITIPQVGIDKTLEDLAKITDINVLNNYLSTLDQSFKDLYSKEIQAKIDVLNQSSQDEADNLTMEDQIADTRRKIQETIGSIKEGNNGGKIWSYVGQFNDQATKFATYEVPQNEYSKEQVQNTIRQKYAKELFNLLKSNAEVVEDFDFSKANLKIGTTINTEGVSLVIIKENTLGLVAKVEQLQTGNSGEMVLGHDSLEYYKEAFNKGKVIINNKIKRIEELEGPAETNSLQKEIDEARDILKQLEEVSLPRVINRLTGNNQAEIKALYDQLRTTKDEDEKKDLNNRIDKLEKLRLSKWDITDLERQKESLEGQIQSAKEFIRNAELEVERGKLENRREAELKNAIWKTADYEAEQNLKSEINARYDTELEELKNLYNEGTQTENTETSTGSGQMLTGTEADNNTGDTGTETSAGKNENLDFFEDTEGQEALEDMILRDFPEILEIGSIDQYFEYRTDNDSNPHGSVEDLEAFKEYLNPEEEEFDDIDYNISTLDPDFFPSLAWETPLKTTGQTVKQEDNADVKVVVDTFTLRVLSNNEYDKQMDNLIQQLNVSNSPISNALNNKEAGLTLVLTQDKKEWYKERGIDEDVEPGVIMVIKSKDNLKGDPETFDSLGIETHLKGPIIFTVNENAFGGIQDYAFKERVAIKAVNQDISYEDAESILVGQFEELTQTRERVKNGEDFTVDIRSVSSGLYEYNKIKKGKKVVVSPYLLNRIIPNKDFDVIINTTDNPDYAGRPTIIVKGETNEISAGTSLLSSAILPNEQTALSYIQDALSKPYETLEEARRNLSNILLLMHTKDASFSIQKDNSISVLNLKGEKMSEKEVDTLLGKTYLRIDATKTKKGTITLEDKKYDYPTFVKNNIKVQILPVKMGNKFVFRGVNSYINFSINENNITFTKTEEMKEELPKVKSKSDILNTRKNNRKKTNIADLAKSDDNEVQHISLETDQSKKTNCNG